MYNLNLRTLELYFWSHVIFVPTLYKIIFFNLFYLVEWFSWNYELFNLIWGVWNASFFQVWKIPKKEIRNVILYTSVLKRNISPLQNFIDAIKLNDSVVSELKKSNKKKE